jgi:hypothetical protein
MFLSLILFYLAISVIFALFYLIKYRTLDPYFAIIAIQVGLMWPFVALDYYFQ